MTGPGGLPRVSRWLLALAAGWSALLIVGALTVPAYSSTIVHTSVRGRPRLVTSSGTLVAVNGVRVLAVVGLPLLATVLVAVDVRRRGRRGRAGGGPLGWIVAGLVSAVSLVGILTVGPVILPVAGLLVAVCAGGSGGQGAAVVSPPGGGP